MTAIDVKELIDLLQRAGRGDDSIIALLKPKDAKALKAKGGSGKTNPKTGLREFDDGGGGGGDGSGDGSGAGAGAGDQSSGFSGYDIGGGLFGGDASNTAASSPGSQGTGGTGAADNTGGSGPSDLSVGGLFGGPEAATNAASAAASAAASGATGSGQGLGGSDQFGTNFTSPTTPGLFAALNDIFGGKFDINTAFNSFMGLFGAPMIGAPFAGFGALATTAANLAGLDQTGGPGDLSGTSGAASGSTGGAASGGDGGVTGAGSTGPQRSLNAGINAITTPEQAAARLASLGAASPSVQALAQALRTVPDIGYSPGGPVFGSDSVETPKQVWNKGSLRVTDAQPTDTGTT